MGTSSSTREQRHRKIAHLVRQLLIALLTLASLSVGLILVISLFGRLTPSNIYPLMHANLSQLGELGCVRGRERDAYNRLATFHSFDG